MEELTNWTDLFITSLRSFGENLMGSIPMIIGALLIFIIGWLIAKIISGVVAKLLKLMKFDELAERVKATSYLKRANVTISPSKLVGKFVYWILILLVLITASDTLGWTNVSEELSKLISYLPKLLLAIVLFIVGTFIASFIRDVIAGATTSLGISTGRVISGFVFYLLFIMVTLTALRQAGVDTSIITSNLLLILGAILAAASISYGFASRDVLANILAGHVGKSTYHKGMHVQIGDIKGHIEDISSIGITILTKDGTKAVVPTKEILNKTVFIYS